MNVLLSLGSNVGDREANLVAALEGIHALKTCAVVRLSHCYETKPVGEVEQPDFLNMAAEIETAYEPLELLDAVKGIEREVGRVPTKRWGPRVIDIDIILWKDRVVSEPELSIPHPEYRHRTFVLAPLAEIAPDAVDPVSGATVTELLADVRLTSQVVRQGRLPFTV